MPTNISRSTFKCIQGDVLESREHMRAQWTQVFLWLKNIPFSLFRKFKCFWSARVKTTVFHALVRSVRDCEHSWNSSLKIPILHHYSFIFRFTTSFVDKFFIRKVLANLSKIAIIMQNLLCTFLGIHFDDYWLIFRFMSSRDRSLMSS